MSRIESLPVDSDLPTSEEEETLQTLYPDAVVAPTPAVVQKSTAILRGFRSELRQCLLIIALFILFSWDATERSLGQLFPFARHSSVVLYALKIVLILFLYLLLTNLSLLWIQ